VKKKNEDKKDMTCKSPVLMTSASKTTLKPRKGSIDDMNIIAREGHDMNMKILEEKLEQEKIKTKLLRLRFCREARLDVNFLY